MPEKGWIITIDYSKNILALVDSTNYGEFDLIFAVKGN